MNQIVLISSSALPALAAAGERASMRFREFLGLPDDLFKIAILNKSCIEATYPLRGRSRVGRSG